MLSAVSRGGCLMGVGMLSGGFGEAVWRVLGSRLCCGEAI